MTFTAAWWCLYMWFNCRKPWIPRHSILSFKDLILLLESLLAFLDRKTLYSIKLPSRSLIFFKLFLIHSL